MKAAFLILTIVICVSLAADATVADWKIQPVSELNKNRTLNDPLEFGVRQFITKAETLKKGSAADFIIESVKSVETQDVKGSNYRYNLTLHDTNQKEHNLTLVVYSQPWTHTLKLVSYALTPNPYAITL